MPLFTQIANRLYDGSYSVIGGIESEIDIGAEVNAIRPVGIRGYADIVWSASFLLTTSATSVDGRYDPSMNKATPDIGWYQICYSNVIMQTVPINEFRLGLPKVTGYTRGAATSYPGDTEVAGNGSPPTLVNIGSDRPIRGNVLKWYTVPDVSGTLVVSVVTNFLDNLSDTAQYIINP